MTMKAQYETARAHEAACDGNLTAHTLARASVRLANGEAADALLYALLGAQKLAIALGCSDTLAAIQAAQTLASIDVQRANMQPEYD